MTYDNELTLISYTTKEDSIGQELEIIDQQTTVLCKIKSISGNEFYKAAQANIRLEMVFIVNAYEYNQEKDLIFKNQKYNVERHHKIEDAEEIELYGKKVI